MKKTFFRQDDDPYGAVRHYAAKKRVSLNQVLNALLTVSGVVAIGDGATDVADPLPELGILLNEDFKPAGAKESLSGRLLASAGGNPGPAIESST